MASTTTATTPSSADSEFLTQVEFDRFYDLHSVGIRHEFRRVFEKMDQFEERMDQFEKKMDHEFELVNRKFDLVDRKFTSLELEVQHLAARLRNSTLTRLHQPVHVIHVLDQSQNLDGIPIVPTHFPRNVKAFLDLRDDISSLTSLCRSYGCHAWESWHHFQSDDSGSGSDEPSTDSDCPRTLEEAVESYTEMALRDLAEVLGLDVDRLDEGLRQFKEYSRIHRRGSQKQRKRSQISLVAAQDVKRQRPSSTRLSPPHPPPADPKLLELIFRDKSSSPRASEPSVHTTLGWAVNSEQFEEYQAALKEEDARKREARRD
ncbi:MAG: hypothetical protein Q9207_004511 [Kuettlingeria erythrocarpa]